MAAGFDYLLIPAGQAARLAPLFRLPPLYQDKRYAVFRAGAASRGTTAPAPAARAARRRARFA